MLISHRDQLSFSKLPALWCYHKVAVYSSNPLDITDIELKSAIMQSLQTHHGKVGAMSHVDVLKITPQRSHTQVILRVNSKHKADVWSAVTLIHSLQGSACSANVIQEAPLLLALLPSSPPMGHHRHQAAVVF